jgi:hypothetical protein
MLAGKLPDSPPRGAGYTSPLRASQQSIGVYKAAGMWQPDSKPHLVQQENTACAGILFWLPFMLTSCVLCYVGPTAKLEHVAERFSAFYSDLEQEKQVWVC